MGLAELSDLLKRLTDEQFVEAQIFNRVPWIFEGNDEGYQGWRTALAGQTDLHVNSFFLVGSAVTGFSLHPAKAGREFRKLSGDSLNRSDLDVAIVSDSLFIDVWNLILQYDRARRLGLSYDARFKLRQGTYWGHLSDYVIPRNTTPARQVRSVVAACGRNHPLRGYKTTVWLYRRLEDLRGYQINSLRELRGTLRRREEVA